MPIYEFQCQSCKNNFEAIVRSGVVPTCPKCQSGDVKKLMSSFAFRSPQSDGSVKTAASSGNCHSCLRSSCEGCH